MPDVTNFQVQALVTAITPDVTNFQVQTLVTSLTPDVTNYQVQALFSPEDIEFTDFDWSWLPSYVYADEAGWTPLFAPSLMDTDPPQRVLRD